MKRRARIGCTNGVKVITPAARALKARIINFRLGRVSSAMLCLYLLYFCLLVLTAHSGTVKLTEEGNG